MICYKCLQAIQSDPIHGLHQRCYLDWFDLNANMDFEDLYSVSSHSSEPLQNDMFNEVNSSFFHGKYKKYSAKINDKHYILKVEEAQFPELPATEYLSNQIAVLLGLHVPHFYLISWNGSQMFVCQNFMKNVAASSNLVHIYHYIKTPNDYNCETLSTIIRDKTTQHTDVIRFIELTLFDSVIGNHDRHGRNLAFIETSKGFELSPFYDNPSYLGIEEEQFLRADHEPRGKIYTQLTTEPTTKDYVKEWNRLGYQDEVSYFYSKIDKNKIADLIQNSFVNVERKEAIKTLLLKRVEEFENALT